MARALSLGLVLFGGPIVKSVRCGDQWVLVSDLSFQAVIMARAPGHFGRYPFVFFFYLPHDVSMGPYLFYCFSSSDLCLGPWTAFVLFSLPAGLLHTLRLGVPTEEP